MPRHVTDLQAAAIDILLRSAVLQTQLLMTSLLTVIPQLIAVPSFCTGAVITLLACIRTHGKQSDHVW